MIKISFSTVTAAVLAVTMLSPVLAIDAHAADKGVYVGGQIGWNNPVRDSGTLDNAASFTGLVGYRFNQNIRADYELGYRKNDYSETALGLTLDGDTKVITNLVNVWYDFHNQSDFTPYVGGGIGFAYGKAEAVEPTTPLAIDESDVTFAYQLGAGVAYNIQPAIALTTDYRFIDTATFSDIGDDYSAHEIRVGVRYDF